MLVITRRNDERVQVIDDHTGEMIIEILVAESRLGKVKLGITAGTRYKVRRVDARGSSQRGAGDETGS